MSEFTEGRRKAIQWIYARRDRVSWWRWNVLTIHNAIDPETLILTDETASMIFADLAHSGLLLPVIADDGLGAHAINMTKEEDWKVLVNPWRAFWWWGTMKVWEQLWVLGVVYLLGILSAFLFGLL